MSTRIPLAQVIENSTGQVRCVCRNSFFPPLSKSRLVLGWVVVSKRWASLSIVSLRFSLPLLSFRHTAVIHQLAYALALEFPLLAKWHIKISFVLSLCVWACPTSWLLIVWNLYLFLLKDIPTSSFFSHKGSLKHTSVYCCTFTSINCFQLHSVKNPRSVFFY